MLYVLIDVVKTLASIIADHYRLIPRVSHKPSKPSKPSKTEIALDDGPPYHYDSGHVIHKVRGCSEDLYAILDCYGHTVQIGTLDGCHEYLDFLGHHWRVS